MVFSFGLKCRFMSISGGREAQEPKRLKRSRVEEVEDPDSACARLVQLPHVTRSLIIWHTLAIRRSKLPRVCHLSSQAKPSCLLLASFMPAVLLMTVSLQNR